MWKINIRLMLAYVILSGSAFANAGIKIDASLDVEKGDTLEVLSAYTNLHIRSWEKSAIKVSGKADPNISDYEFSLHEGTVRYKEVIGTRITQESYISNNTLSIYVPTEIDMVVRTAFGNIRIEKINGQITATSESGNIFAHHINNTLALMTHEGNIKITDSNADTKAHSLKGNIEVYKSGGNFTLNAIDGNIFSNSNFDSLTISNVDGSTKLKFTTIRNLSVNSSNGDIDIQTTILEKTRANIKSVLGNIQLSTPPISNAEFKAETHRGKIKNYVNDTAPKFDRTREIETLFFRVGEVDSKFEVKSINGSITLFELDNIPSDKKKLFLARELKKFELSNFDTFYFNPEAITGGKKSIYFEPLTVTFTKEWESYFKSELSENGKEELRALYKQLFQLRVKEWFTDTDRFNLVKEQSASSLRVAPKISISVSQHMIKDNKSNPNQLEHSSITHLDVTIVSTKDGVLVAQVKDFGCGCVNSYKDYKNEDSINVRAYKKVFYWWSKELFENLAGKFDTKTKN